MNWKLTRSLDTHDRPGKSSPFASTPPRTDLSENRASGQGCESRVSRSSGEPRELSADVALRLQINDLTYVFSSTWQKSAQLVENRYFQVPVFCDTCALFACKSRVFSILTKNTRAIVSATVNQKPKALLEVLEPSQITGTRRGRRPPSLINNLGIYGDGGRFFETLSLQRSSVSQEVTP